MVYKIYSTYALIMLLTMILRLMFNQKKSQCVVHKPDKFELSSPEIALDGSSLNYVDDIKYLGVVLNNLCRDDSDIRGISEACMLNLHYY